MGTQENKNFGNLNNNNNTNNFESRVKYITDYNFKNPDSKLVNNPQFKVNDEIGKKCMEFTNEFRRRHGLPNSV